MGGIEPAYTFVKRALEAGKSVCTSRRLLLPNMALSLWRLPERRISTFFLRQAAEAVFLCTPCLKFFSDCTTNIDEITGILNGTTNYMLYKMSTEGCEFDTVLKEAQAKGYAEADPTADVEGYDACRKIAILSSLAYGKFLNYEEIYTEGITKITPEDMAYAAELGMTIKLLGPPAGKRSIFLRYGDQFQKPSVQRKRCI